MKAFIKGISGTLGVSVLIIWFTVLVVGLGGLILFGKLLVLPYVYDMEREAVTHSRFYTESHESALLLMYENYMAEEPESNHAKALLLRIKREAGRLPESQVPREIKKLIGE